MAAVEAVTGASAQAPGGGVECGGQADPRPRIHADPVDLGDRVEEEAARLERRIGAHIVAIDLDAVERDVKINARRAVAEADPEDGAAVLPVEAALDASIILLVAGVEDGGDATVV